MVKQMEIIKKTVESQGYTYDFLKLDEFEILLFYQNQSSKSTKEPIWGVAYGFNNITNMIAVGCLCGKNNEMEFECHTGIYSSLFNDESAVQKELFNCLAKFDSEFYRYTDIAQAINTYKRLFYES